MTGPNIFRGGRVWDAADFKSLSFVPDDEGDFISPTTTANVNLLPRVLMIAVNHGVRHSLT